MLNPQNPGFRVNEVDRVRFGAASLALFGTASLVPHPTNLDISGFSLFATSLPEHLNVTGRYFSRYFFRHNLRLGPHSPVFIGAGATITDSLERFLGNKR